MAGANTRKLPEMGHVPRVLEEFSMIYNNCKNFFARRVLRVYARMSPKLLETQQKEPRSSEKVLKMPRNGQNSVFRHMMARIFGCRPLHPGF